MQTRPIHRRDALKVALSASALLTVGRTVPSFIARSALVSAAEGGKGDRVLVVIQLAGGNDGVNTVVPFKDPEYNKNRIVLRQDEGALFKLNDSLGLHPSMSAMAKLYDDGKLAVLQGIGYPNPDRSHFRSMDIWNSARPDLEQPKDGWLGRTLEVNAANSGSDVPGLYLGPNELPLAMISDKVQVPGVESLESFRFRTDGGSLPLASLAQLAEVKRQLASPLLDFVQTATLNAYASSEQVRHAVEQKGTNATYPAYGLANKLKGIAQLIDAGLTTRIYYVSLDGFDTHANQNEAHNALLSELSDSLRAFIDDLTVRGHLDRVAVMMFSEFGRRVRENASLGTDHGAAAPMFLAGGGIAAGVHGAHPSMTDLDDGDLKFHTDFRSVYATLLDKWLACPSEQVLHGKFDHLPVLKA